jgi:hypothetical protein
MSDKLTFRGMKLAKWIREYHKQSTIRKMTDGEVETLSLITAALKWESHCEIQEY